MSPENVLFPDSLFHPLAIAHQRAPILLRTLALYNYNFFTYLLIIIIIIFYLHLKQQTIDI